jgi:hypothetical protein
LLAVAVTSFQGADREGIIAFLYKDALRISLVVVSMEVDPPFQLLASGSCFSVTMETV